MRARAIGVSMSDDTGRDDRHRRARRRPEYEHYRDIAELPPHRSESSSASSSTTKFENKVVNIDDLRGRARAEETIRGAVRLYRDTIREAPIVLGEGP